MPLRLLPSVSPALRSFVATALERRLELEDAPNLKALRERLYADGRVRIRVTGSDGSNVLPFELNINARVDDDMSPLRLQACFSASVKFGGQGEEENARICVTKLDGSHGGWHLHQYDSGTGTYVPTRSGRVRPLPELNPHNLTDALLFTLRLFCKWEITHEHPDQLGLPGSEPEGVAVPLVV